VSTIGRTAALVVLWACLSALWACGAGALARAPGARFIDGISDQSLPAWYGSFPASPFASFLSQERLGGDPRQITMARYVVQWNVASEPSTGADAAGDYRERLEAWLADVASAGLTPVLALTSYDGERPRGPAQYAPALSALLALAAAQGSPVHWVEAWNEPNDQGGEPPAAAAAFADAASSICAAGAACTVIAGDLQDGPQALAYELEYERALRFAPRVWGFHPYVAVKHHDAANLLELIAALPDGGAGSQIWFTEVGAYYCEAGALRGEALQAQDAEYLLRLIADPALAPTHVFYYGFLYKDGEAAPCEEGSGASDTELFGPAGRPRAAAEVLLGGIAGARSFLFGPAP